MPPREILSEFDPTPPQMHFLMSRATVRGYGGAMGGGKSRTMCEAILDYALDYPGIQILVVRQKHTAIIETTKKTMMRDVLGPIQEMIQGSKSSQGEDWVELKPVGKMILPDGSERTWENPLPSRINFIGLDDPVKWYSSEVGVLVFDEAHEIAEGDVVQLMTRLRQRGMPHDTLIGFNPGNPGHWLQEWFILGAEQTEFGFYKRELVVSGADAPIGDAEFVFASALDNPYLPEGYIDRTLRSLPEILRRRLLDGEWVLSDGSLFFDAEALTEYGERLVKPWRQGKTAGDVTGASREDRIRIEGGSGPLAVWKPPVWEVDGKPAHRYIVSVDVSSGGGADYSGIQVVDVDAFEQVAELQIKADPDLVAVEVFRLACIYNGALVAAEVTGGWGYTINSAIEKLLPKYKGARQTKPRLYTRRVMDRLSKAWTDVLGFDTNVKTRMVMLDGLEQAIRERELDIPGTRTYTELKSFARDDKGRPAALPGKHDDLVMSLAIGVYVASMQPRHLRRQRRQEDHRALVSATGY